MIAVAMSLAAVTALFGAGNAWADPPTRVARLSYVSGTVSFSPAGDDQWAQAVLNRPLVTGDRLWSDAGARSELAFDNGVVWLGAATSLVVSNMDDSTAQFELQQGAVDLRVRQLPQGAVVEVDTPNLAFQVTRPGRYRLVVDPQSGTTSVIVKDGAAAVYGEQASYAIAGGESYRFAGTDLQDGGPVAIEVGAEFERFADERDGRFARVASARYVSPEVVGYEDLDQYGTWQPNPEYGNVWYPREVPSGWAPYRYGHWSWIDPWGWTWVDEAAWGFAPFHYGRWAYVSNRWGWVPGPVNVRPVYAPALVAFVGGAGFSVAVSSGPAIGWFPLGPREVYRPAYNVSREYYRQVNVSNTVINTTVINNTYVSNVTSTTTSAQPRGSYRNLQAPNAVTAVAPAAFAQGQRVDRVAVKMPANSLNNAQIQPLARVAPARTAFVGDAPAARATPPAAIRERAGDCEGRTTARAGADRAEADTTLERDPGKPLDRAQMQAARPAGSPAAPERNVKVVNAAKAPVAPPPIAQRDNARAGKPAPVAAPVATPRETPTAQGRKPEEAGKVPAAPTPPTEAARPTPVAPAPTPPRVVTTPPPAAMPAPLRGENAKSTTPREPNAPTAESATKGPPRVRSRRPSSRSLRLPRNARPSRVPCRRSARARRRLRKRNRHVRLRQSRQRRHVRSKRRRHLRRRSRRPRPRRARIVRNPCVRRRRHRRRSVHSRNAWYRRSQRLRRRSHSHNRNARRRRSQRLHRLSHSRRRNPRPRRRPRPSPRPSRSARNRRTRRRRKRTSRADARRCGCPADVRLRHARSRTSGGVGRPCRDRTYDQRIKSPLLYQLS